MPSRMPRFWSVAGIALPVLLLLAGPTSAVRASCGDYVHIGSPAREAATRFSTMGGPAGETKSFPAPQPDSPCKGASCQRAPLAPPPTPPPHSTSSSHEAILNDQPTAESPKSSPLAGEPIFSSLLVLCSVFHPPRA